MGRFATVGLIFLAASVVWAGDFRIDPHHAGGWVESSDFSFSFFIHGDGWTKCGKVEGGAHQRVELPPKDGRVAFRSVVEDGVSCACEMSSHISDGVLSVAYRALVEKPGRVETVSVQGYLAASGFDGGRLFVNGAKYPLSSSINRECGRIRRLRIESADATRFLDFTFPRPVIASVTRKEGAASYQLRLSAVRHAELAAGKTIEIGFTLRADHAITDPNTPWRAQAGDRFVPLEYKADIVKGSALDFTGIVQRSPCGIHGRLRAKGGSFEFDRLPGVRQKFYGVNLHSYACYYAPDEAARLADLFVRLGYNAVRLHNFENEYMGLTMGSADEATPVAERFEGLDNLFAACAARGLYITLDLHVGRTTSFRAIGIDRPGAVRNDRGNRNEMKYQYLVNPGARANFKRFVRGFFEHVNPRLGRRYADEPTLALVNVVNESPCGWSCGDGTVRDLCEQEHSLMREIRALIREDLKSDVPLASCNGGSMPFCLQAVRSDFCDYVDDHFYYDHPSWPDDAKWTSGDRVPLYTPNRRLFAEFAEIPPQALLTRLWGKPYVITEFNWCAPSVRRAGSGLLVGAMAAAQDWDGLWRYLWSHDKARALEPGRHVISKLESASDPLAIAADRALMCLFLRGDLKPLDRCASLVFPRSELEVSKPHPCIWSNELAWPWAGWYAQIGSAVGNGPTGSVHNFSYPGDVKLSRERVETALGATNLKPADGAVSIDRMRNMFTVATPSTCGGSVDSGAFRAGPLSADCGNQTTTLWASSLDGDETAASRRILLTHLTQLYNTGDSFADRDGRYLLESGRLPYLMPRAKARVWLAVRNPGEMRVYALDTDGRRRTVVPSVVRKGVLAFTCDTARDASNATYLYEIVREKRARAEMPKRLKKDSFTKQ